MLSQSPSAVLMIRPASFGFNHQTSDSNAFQKNNQSENSHQILAKAIREFDKMVKILKENGVSVIVIQDAPLPVKPDSVFPNNWISFHHDGSVIIYPMMAENRRTERRLEIMNILQKKHHFNIRKVIDLAHFEKERKFLEGTGSIVFDYHHKIAFAAESPRTDPSVLEILCNELGFETVLFEAVDLSGKAIYHTNVMMCIGSHFVIICSEAIRNQKKRKEVLDIFNRLKFHILEISYGQMSSFAGNMIQLKGNKSKDLLVMSGNAYRSLSSGQISEIAKYVVPVIVEIPVIEETGGGSARCMIAGVFLPKFEKP
jgi:hypothetical protein